MSQNRLDDHRVFDAGDHLRQIRWRRFMSDYNSLVAEYAELEKFLAEEINRSNVWLVENHQDIQESFDPKVVKLKKKNKIIMTESALDDLSRRDANKE
ncbi:MAG: hypothetical protein HPY30_04170 [Gammaproteobacteria bacterium (ex Lamellibrachia satsuma)]|nr:MAG: hypothetical protein HPY30_04170 [Gammaproteobacteria bacterium (ex Lamellibrachia satsuma)]